MLPMGQTDPMGLDDPPLEVDDHLAAPSTDLMDKVAQYLQSRRSAQLDLDDVFLHFAEEPAAVLRAALAQMEAQGVLVQVRCHVSIEPSSMIGTAPRTLGQGPHDGYGKTHRATAGDGLGLRGALCCSRRRHVLAPV
jgi:hypothetical protein